MVLVVIVLQLILLLVFEGSYLYLWLAIWTSLCAAIAAWDPLPGPVPKSPLVTKGQRAFVVLASQLPFLKTLPNACFLNWFFFFLFCFYLGHIFRNVFYCSYDMLLSFPLRYIRLTTDSQELHEELLFMLLPYSDVASCALVWGTSWTSTT